MSNQETEPKKRWKLDATLRLVGQFERLQRGPGLAPIEISGVYDLHQKDADAPTELPGWEIAGHWPDPYPNGGEAGVYLIMDPKLEILYVGKASMSSSVGLRLGSYFCYQAGKGTPFKIIYEDGWNPKPRFIVTLTFHEKQRFEAPALEEYLIHRVGGLLNIRGTS